MARRALVTLGLLALAACGDDADPDTGLVLSVQGDGGLAIGEYLAVVSGGEPTTTALLDCSDDGLAEVFGASCDGATLRPDPAHITRVLLKAPRHDYVEVDPGAVGGGHKALVVPRLPDAEETDDYATRIADAGHFEALSIGFTTELGPTRVLKFYVDDLQGLEGPPTVYFQDTQRHQLHYDFYRNVLGGSASRSDFEQATYYEASEDRVAAAGTLVAYPDLTEPFTAPVALTFFPSDDLSPALALRIHKLIEARLGFLNRRGTNVRLVYVPAGARQEATVAAAAPDFERADAPWARQRDLYGGLTQQLLNEGVAYGTLRRMTPEQLESAVVSFRDVLVLTRLPNDLPLVGGTITEELQTPLAHVNVAARGRGTPNLALLDAGDHPDIEPLLGEVVRFEVRGDGWSIGAVNLEEAQAFWDSRVPEPFAPEADVTTTGLLPFSEIGFGHAVTVGVKAANLAELRSALDDQSPDGFAVPFYYYDRFVATTQVPPALCADARADCVEEGRAAAICDAAEVLCAPADPASPETVGELSARLLADAGFETDSALREASLDGLRWIMRHLPVDAELGAALDAEVAARFGTARVRLRSSTNAEDLPNFSGAGLYTSVGADTAGGDDPSDEIRKVWASVWNWRAFEERAFWGIDHAAIRVGVAVHAAFPDEVLNGVLITRNLADPTIYGYYVNLQEGEVSVTNPTSGVTPEILTLTAGRTGLRVLRQSLSSLSPDAPLMDDGELTALYLAAKAVQAHFAALYGVDSYSLVLDMEFKLDGPDRRLVIKQVRPYAQATGATQ